MRKQSTQRQRDVLDVLQRQGRPMTACEILDELKGDEAGLAPSTVYRTLSALTDQGSAHRLESINAFVSCQCAHEGHTPILAICDDCGTVEEHADASLMDRLTTITGGTGFHAHRHVVEVRSLCVTCTT